MKLIYVTTLSSALISLSTPIGWAANPTSGYVAHEWGTFTSLQDSEGNTVEGLAHEEEALPAFVHGRAHTQLLQQKTLFDPNPHPPHGPTKDLEFIPAAGTPTSVTQKMETPVIYFYSQSPQHLKVDVDFPGGIISQYYPNVSDFSPALGEVDAVANGHVHWDVDVATKALNIPQVDSGNIWAPSRKTQSNFISSQGENEKLIFYRGVGNFKTDLQTSSDANGGLQVTNHSAQTIQDAFLLRVTTTGNSIRKLGSIASHAQISLLKTEVDTLPAGNALDFVAQALEKSGLYPDEAQAMVHTWEKSYFKTPGLRVLYILPREWTDTLLPLNIQPEPYELVRTLVGRVEVFTPSEEASILSSLKSSYLTNSPSSILPPVIQNLGRFGESKLRRILQLSQRENDSPGFVNYVQNLINLSEQQ